MRIERSRTLHPLLVVASLLLSSGVVDAGVLLRNRTVTAADSAAELPPGDPATVIVAGSGRVTADWRRDLGRSGAQIVSYLPGNAFLVMVSNFRKSFS